MRFPAALWILCAAAAVAALPAAAATAPALSVHALSDLPIDITRPYDGAGAGPAAIDAALAAARSDGKRVLVEFGGDWCVDCIILANVMHLPEMSAFVSAHYDVVLVNVGRFDRNLDLAARYGLALRRDGVPAVLILDADGRLLNAGHTSALANARRMQPQAIADWLALWTP